MAIVKCYELRIRINWDSKQQKPIGVWVLPWLEQVISETKVRVGREQGDGIMKSHMLVDRVYDLHRPQNIGSGILITKSYYKG